MVQTFSRKRRRNAILFSIFVPTIHNDLKRLENIKLPNESDFWRKHTSSKNQQHQPI